MPGPTQDVNHHTEYSWVNVCCPTSDSLPLFFFFFYRVPRTAKTRAASSKWHATITVNNAWPGGSRPVWPDLRTALYIEKMYTDGNYKRTRVPSCPRDSLMHFQVCASADIIKSSFDSICRQNKANHQRSVKGNHKTNGFANKAQSSCSCDHPTSIISTRAPVKDGKYVSITFWCSPTKNSHMSYTHCSPHLHFILITTLRERGWYHSWYLFHY